MLADNILTEVFHLSNIYSMKVVILSIPFFFCMYAFQCNSTHTLNHFFCVELNLWSVHCIHFVCVHWMEYFNTGKLLCNSRCSHGFHGGFVHTRRLYMCGAMQLYCQYAVSTACMVSHSLVQLVSPESPLVCMSAVVTAWALMRFLHADLSGVAGLCSHRALAALRLQNWEQTETLYNYTIIGMM